MAVPVDWAAVIRRIAPRGKPSIINGLADAMPQIIDYASLNTQRRQAHFLAQTAHESDGFKTTTEYASGAAYEGRKDLGNTKRGDGKKFRGRGLIQLTGRNNYGRASRVLGVDLLANPELAAQFPAAAFTAALFWKDHQLNHYADADDIKTITHRINGGYNGLSDRKRYLGIAKLELNEVTLAQRRLASLNYPSGKPDGSAGLLTRSAVRDFQDANSLPVTGQLDHTTKTALFSPDATVRPVSEYRANLTAAELKEDGSNIIAGAQDAKLGAIGTGLASAAGVASQVTTISDNISGIAEGVKSGASVWGFVQMYWPIMLGVTAAAIGIYFAWRAYRGAQVAEDHRVLNARTGINVAR